MKRRKLFFSYLVFNVLVYVSIVSAFKAKNRKAEMSKIDLIAPCLITSFWLVISMLEARHESIVFVVEILILWVFVTLVYYAKIFAIDPKVNKPVVSSITAFIVCLISIVTIRYGIPGFDASRYTK